MNSETGRISEDAKLHKKNKLTSQYRQPSSALLLNAIPQQVWTANRAGEIDYVNEIVCRDFGHNQETILNLGWTAFVHQDDLAESIGQWKASLESGDEYTVEFRLLFSDGKYYWHLARARMVRQKGKPEIWVGTNTNIQDQKINESRKDEFISIASHELKTPLTSIKGYYQLLLRLVDKDPAKNYLQRTAGQLNRLEKLIQDLLDVSKINAGRMILDLALFSFSDMLEDTVEGMREIYPTHRLIVEQENGVTYKGDRFRLEQVIQNFVSNAVKYSPAADKVNIRTNIVDDNIIVSVTDYGIGIEQKSLNRLFERYYRADNTSTKFEGLGLGLFISADIIKRHGGSFWIESEPGQGSVFSFKLPLIQDQSIQPDIYTDSYYKDRHLTISCPAASGIMYVEWTGYQDMHSVKHGGSLMIDYLKNNGCSKVFNDNRLVPGTWSEASDWAAKVWLPLMELAGLRFFAWILSKSAFSQLSAMKSIENDEKSAEIVFFDQAEEGMKWLKNMK
ncbi:sensor histidine kinase [Pedobacter kyonggii]|uniref:histidine kinase n=1 Tax=Pedobacter kyonggii TaxID=1926871 RepID=A0A4Q9H6C4_9SPHI|nr:PAS domain-containing sensor histidine kinase [Pedobacter kyonggii]TBO36404.1 PAS domain S-box protein [Pedobacter kyonggii]